MPFLTINGVTVPVETAAESVSQIYGDTRSYLGFGAKGRVARKRSWAIKTPPIDHETAQALLGIITCRGDVWGFDDLTLFSQKGILASPGLAANAAPAYIVNSAAADGSFNPCAPPFSAYSIYPGTGRQNVLPTANDASYETSNPLVPYNGTTVGLDSTHAYQGSKSVMVTDSIGDGSYRGVICPLFSGLTAGSTACFSIMLYNGLGQAAAFVLSLYSDTGSNLGSGSANIPAGGWYRLSLSFTVPQSGKFQWSVTSNGGPGSWWVDGSMLEYAGTPSPWINVGASALGPTVSATANFSLPFANATNYGGPDSADSEISVACWTQFTGITDTSVRSRKLFTLCALGGNPQIVVRLDQYYSNFMFNGQSLPNYTNPHLSIVVANDAGLPVWGSDIYQDLTYSSNTDLWHYVVLNVRTSPHSGGYWLELIVDGQRTGASLPASAAIISPMPTLSKINTLQIDLGGTSCWAGQYNEIQVNPYCIPVSVARQLYAAQPTVRPVAPRIIGNGSMFGNIATSLQGSKASLAAEFLHGSANPTGLGPQAILSFTLDEI